MIQMTELVGKNIKIIIINILHMFKKIEERMSVLRREVDFSKGQIKSMEKKIARSNMKNTLNGTNRTRHGIRKNSKF